MRQPLILFKAPALMVVKYSAHFGGGAAVVLMCRNAEAKVMKEEAASLLLDYLKVIKAFFQYSGGSKKQLHHLYAALARRLDYTNRNELIQRCTVSAVIEELGCPSDWVHKMPSILS